MQSRAVRRRCALIGVCAVLVVTGSPASSHLPNAPVRALPVCAPAPPSSRPPDRSPSLDDPAACRAAPTRIVESAAPGALDRLREAGRLRAARGWERRTPPGYHHLGATTAGDWAGVSGRLTVRDATVRADTYDFVATRFMAKRHSETDDVAWLEAGWAETGWAGAGRQRIYTFDTNGRAWRFYDDYAVRDGDRVWLHLHAAADSVWQAWLWWGDRWNLLSAERLPIGAAAQLEQYVELYVDGHRPGWVSVPPVTVDNVRLRGAGDGPERFWRDDVSTYPSGERDERRGFCVDWTTRFDTWSAGAC